MIPFKVPFVGGGDFRDYMTMRRTLPYALAGALVIALAVGLGACRNDMPESSSAAYRDAVAAFHAGLAGIQTGANRHAEENLTRVTEIAPEEPAAWANLGVLALREARYDDAGEYLERARTLAPDDGRIYFLLGILAQSRGRSQEAIEYLRRARELRPNDLKISYALVQEIERQGDADHRARASELIEEMIAARPENLVLVLERARFAVQRGDEDVL